MIRPGPKRFVIRTFATPRYEAHAAAFEASAERASVSYLADRLPEFEDWGAATRHKAVFLRDELERQRDSREIAIVWLDVDARLRAYPRLFDTIWDKCDVAAYRTPAGEVLSGTVFLRNNLRVLAMLDTWIEVAAANPHKFEQDGLRSALAEHRDVNVSWFPVEYCWVDRFCVIEHLQASRELRV